ncbi:hypothetical protein MPTK1_6g12180 [Marchantia polymorpha subsp. ruderalis]|uniref:Major facilitator superfamily (MFS) profile domain-containing protein n=3 Tax=Marchantia polymorpha TaxID=3197 RepID=A0AAF6BR57_MARPO|nr:hypothetical protein MARPO_0135s0018 [Marchantia polymorpha]BBN14491.1 hypothetical protein Mp_6g12180 [Marchantia polymorpha subsp. ruderalis]|eukprot:PTQ29733.1 hypothetical protein MARPO_0135s0018 [Marchantia polymorpha]
MMESSLMSCSGRILLPLPNCFHERKSRARRFESRSSLNVNLSSDGAWKGIRRRQGAPLANMFASRNGGLVRRPNTPYSLPPNVKLDHKLLKDGDDKEDNEFAATGGEDNDEQQDFSLAAADAPSIAFWDKFPQRYKLIVTTSLAFVVCNMDKVNMSVAIIPMAHQLGWSASTSGLVQSSFFWGYCLSQLPGGFLAGRFSGKKVLRAGVLVWSLATALVPLTATFLPGLLFCRLLVGLGEGVSPSAATDLIARTMPINERARAVSFVFGGLNVGSIVGLLLAPAIIKLFGWEVVFYLFGLIGIGWCLAFDSATTEVRPSSTSTPNSQVGENGNAFSNGQVLKSSPASTSKAASKAASDAHAATFDISDKAIPWRAFFKEPALWAMIYAHFCGNWGYYNLLAWFPTYFSEELNLDLTNAALVSILPPLGSVVVSGVASSLADHLISKGVDTTKVRKLCQTIAFMSPAVCMGIASFCPGLPPWLIAVVLTAGSSLSTFTLAGLYCTHQDISPKYASILLGITNTVGAIPGILGVALTGYILDQTNSWTLALFAPSIFFYVTGTVVWNLFASSKPKEF